MLLSLLFFLIFIDKISRTSIEPTWIKIDDVKMDSLLFTDGVARLMTSDSKLQMTLNQFDKMCSNFRMKTSEKKNELSVISRDDNESNIY